MPERSRFWILDGHELKPAEILEWARWFEDAKGRQVAIDHMCVNGEEIAVSTACLGYDEFYEINDAGPRVFGTYVFGGPMAGHEEKYATLDEAERGHAVVVKAVRDALARARR